MRNIKRRTEGCSHQSGNAQVTQKMGRRELLNKLFLAPLKAGLFFFVAGKVKATDINGFREMMELEETGFAPEPSVAPPEDAYVPNAPMGRPQGIFPGRVSWVWNPSSTNPGCTNSLLSASNPEQKYDPWFSDQNTNQESVDQMLIAGLCSMTGKEDIREAWDAAFRFHNKKRGKGDVSYQPGEKIYLKLNRTSAAAGLNPEFGRLEDKPISLLCETSPQVVLSMLRQLVNVAGVPQENIYVGDAMRDIFQDEYLKYHAEFPGVNYLSNTTEGSGRIKSQECAAEVIFYSDNKSVMTRAGSDKIYAVLEEADYLVSLAAMKGHNAAGISLCTKNHFGTQSRSSAGHLHPGLNSRSRMGYGYYRVLADLMGNRHTGGKNLFYILDALWTGGNWNALPARFQMPPFNNHWSSSLLLSQDPVAIESVAFDFLRTEFSRPEYGFPHINAPGVDDYLHQTADSANWPEGIEYAPDGEGTRMADSLGVHEHWNNTEEKQYSGDLGTGKGIELVKIFQEGLG